METVGYYVDLALAETIIQQSETTRTSYASWARALKTRWSERLLTSITRRDLQTWVNERRLKVRPASIVSELSFLSRVYRVANDCGSDAVYPGKGLRLPRINNRREFVLEASREHVVQRTMGNQHYSVVRFAINTGLRRLELFRLRIEDLHFFDAPDGQRIGIAHISTSKTGVGRNCPLNPDAVEIAERWAKLGGPHLFFPERENRVYAARWFYRAVYKPAVTAAGASHLHFHDLRHTTASRCLLSGSATLIDVMHLLGHKSVKQTERYAHWDQSAMWPAAWALMGRAA